MQGGELVGRAAGLQGAAGLAVGQDHDLVRVENFSRLGHEMDAAEDDHLGIRLGGLLGQAERIAHKIRYVLDLGHLIVVGQDDGVELLF